MKGFRSALIVMTGERYVVLSVNFALIAIIARLLTPEEFGIHVIGGAIAAIALTVAREFAPPIYLVQRKELLPDDVRSAVTVMLLLTSAVSAALIASSPWVSNAYGHDKLAFYLGVIAVAFLIELISEPIRALMQRDMDFNRVAMLNVSGVTVGAVATISFAWLGFSFMSFAWGWLFTAITKAIFALYLRPVFWIFRPKLSHWRDILTFSGFNGTNVLLHQIYDTVPYLFFGRLLSAEAAGLYNRAITLCRLPDQAFLGGLLAVAVPAFSAEVREGRSLRGPYLKAIECITAVQWPALVILALLAHPIVLIVLGTQWLGVVSIVQIVALAWAFSFSASLNYPVLVSLGKMRDVFIRALIIWPASAAILSFAALFGLKAVAFSMFFVLQFQAFVSMQIVRRHLKFEWRDLARALSKSVIVTLCSAAGPLVIIGIAGFRFDISIIAGLIAGLAAAPGWIGGLWITRHPLFDEIVRTMRSVLQRLNRNRALKLAGGDSKSVS
jgi:O-antigen/teichoic acid export membrane protein